MGVVVRRYIDILTIINNLPYTPLILALFLAAVSLLLCSFLKCFFGLVYVICLQYISKRYSKNIRDRSKKLRSREYNYYIISIIKNVVRASIERARESRDFHVRGTERCLSDVAISLCVREWRRRGSLLHV